MLLLGAVGLAVAISGLSGCQQAADPFGSLEDELSRLESLEGLTCQPKQRFIVACSYQNKIFYITSNRAKVNRISIPNKDDHTLLMALGPHYGFSPSQLARVVEAKPGIRVTRDHFSLWQEGPVIRLTKS